MQPCLIVHHCRCNAIALAKSIVCAMWSGPVGGGHNGVSSTWRRLAQGMSGWKGIRPRVFCWKRASWQSLHRAFCMRARPPLIRPSMHGRETCAPSSLVNSTAKSACGRTATACPATLRNGPISHVKLFCHRLLLTPPPSAYSFRLPSLGCPLFYGCMSVCCTLRTRVAWSGSPLLNVSNEQPHYTTQTNHITMASGGVLVRHNLYPSFQLHPAAPVSASVVHHAGAVSHAHSSSSLFACCLSCPPRLQV
jgi:hypothetical protein